MNNDRIPKRETIPESFRLVIEYWVLVINWSLVIGDWLFIMQLTNFYLAMLFYHKSMLNNLHAVAVYSDDIKPYLFVKALMVF